MDSHTLADSCPHDFWTSHFNLSIVKTTMSNRKIVITGAAGLVGQDLLPRLKRSGLGEIVAIDKHVSNTEVLRRFHPEIRVVHADLAVSGVWEQELQGCTHLVSAHAQIGGLNHDEF